MNSNNMPDVVTKVTQNSMSFTAEQKSRKQAGPSQTANSGSTQVGGYIPSAGMSLTSVVTPVPALTPGVPSKDANSESQA